jgi:hypothetical protein
MKKIFVFVMSAALLAACDNPLEYNPENKADELIVNAFLDAGETSHLVQLAVSSTEYVKPVEKAELRFYVNGELKARTTEFEDHTEWQYNTTVEAMHFEASFKAGDVVRLEVDADGKYSAYNEQVVPPAPTVPGIDTVRVMQTTKEDYSAEYLRFDYKVSDTEAEENYFRIKIEGYASAIFYDKDDKELKRDSRKWMNSLRIDNDPILNGGYIDSGDSGFELELGTRNTYCVFSDMQFSGASVTLRPMVYANSFVALPAIPEGTESAIVDNYAIATIQSLPQRYFYYMKALNMLQDGSDDLALEDVQIADNVEGGIGFVGVSNSVSKSFWMGTKEYDELVYYEDYPIYQE